MAKLLQLIPEYHQRVWGGQRLQAADKPVGEAWIVYAQNRIASGPWVGRSLAEVAAEQGADLLGEHAFRRTGTYFPLLIKLLDCHDWLSIQVHPNDEQAVQLEGPGHFGKTEAWHILEADPGAQLIAGVKPGVTQAALTEAIRQGTLLEWVQYHSVQAGDTIFIPAGTLHALGPGLLLYEVQQTSDITYRVFDWNRPASAGRALHIEQSLAVVDPSAQGQLQHLPASAASAASAKDEPMLLTCPYFTLDLLKGQSTSLALDTHGETFHIVTVIEGQVEIECAGERLNLKRFETVLVPASVGAYTLRALGAFRALKAGVVSDQK